MPAELTAEMVTDGLVPADPQLSPDGRLVAFSVAPAGKREEHPQRAIWLAATDGSTPPRKITAGVVNDSMPRWSPDGSALYFLSDRGERGKAQLHRLPLAGGEAEALTDWQASVQGFAGLPRERMIALLAQDAPTD